MVILMMQSALLRVTTVNAVSYTHLDVYKRQLANFVIRVHNPVENVSIPANGVAREADGTMTAWVTTDRHHFVQRVVRTGLRSDGHVQILDGLHQGELVVSDGAVFLSNMLEAPPTD